MYKETRRDGKERDEKKNEHTCHVVFKIKNTNTNNRNRKYKK